MLVPNFVDFVKKKRLDAWGLLAFYQFLQLVHTSIKTREFYLDGNLKDVLRFLILQQITLMRSWRILTMSGIQTNLGSYTYRKRRWTLMQMKSSLLLKYMNFPTKLGLNIDTWGFSKKKWGKLFFERVLHLLIRILWVRTHWWEI